MPNLVESKILSMEGGNRLFVPPFNSWKNKWPIRFKFRDLKAASQKNNISLKIRLGVPTMTKKKDLLIAGKKTTIRTVHQKTFEIEDGLFCSLQFFSAFHFVSSCHSIQAKARTTTPIPTSSMKAAGLPGVKRGQTWRVSRM